MLIENHITRLNNSGRVPYLEFLPLKNIPFIIHAFSTRLGGVSSGMFSSLNLASGSSPYQDDPEKIKENFIRIAESIGVEPESMVFSDQVHKTNIRLVNFVDRGKGFINPRDYSEIDGLITNTPGVTLVTRYADCVPIFFVDPVRKAIGLSHAGWKGTVGRIGPKTVYEMNKAFGSNPEDIVSVIGPSICAGCYEVGKDVADRFKEINNIMVEDGNNPVLLNKGGGKYRLDLWEANRRLLLKAGLKHENIHISGVCTACNHEILFSHRKTGGKRGSLAAFLAIKD